MTTTRLAAVADGFGRDVEQNLAQIATYVEAARAQDVALLAFPRPASAGTCPCSAPAATAPTPTRPRTSRPRWTSTAPSCGGSPRSRAT